MSRFEEIFTFHVNSIGGKTYGNGNVNTNQ